MVLKIIRWTKGYVDFSLHSKTPERFLNLCSLNGVNIWNTKPTSFGLTASISIFDYRNIRYLLKKTKGKSNINNKHGMPFFVQKYKARTGLAVGVLVFIAICMYLSSFIWSVNIIGAENISNQRIIETLESNGLTVGSFKNSLNIQQIQRNTMLEIKEIGWMSINIQDGCANVEIKEKVFVPEMKTETFPCNIVAGKDGVITDYRVSKGAVDVKIGSAVSKGQMLVNSVIENKRGGIDFVHSEAEVYADVIETKFFTSSLERYYQIPTGNKTNRYSFNIFNFNLPATLGNSNYKSSIKQQNTYKLASEYNVLPLGLIEETEIEYSNKEKTFTEPEMRKALFKEMALFEIFCKPNSNVKSRTYTGGCANGKYKLTVNYVFNEDIAKQQELYIAD